LHRDLAETMSRQDLLRVAARLGLEFGAVQVLGCGSDDTIDPSECQRIPEETAGPFPADGPDGGDLRRRQ
jgi:hypothetical protein